MDASPSERAPLATGDPSASPAPFTAATSPPRGVGVGGSTPPATFDGVAPPPLKAAPPFFTSPSTRRAALVAALVVLFLAGVGAFSLVGGRRAPTPVRAGVDTVSVPGGARKVGAGILLWREDDNRILLLQRKSKHHDRAWGLPGGNADESDGSLLDTAEREAAEEMGGLPAGFSVLHRLDTRRDAKTKKKPGGDGDDDDDDGSFKFYAVFVCRVPGSGAAAFKPRLEDDEVRDWRWWSIAEATALAATPGGLHPVVADVLTGAGGVELGQVLEGARAGEARGD